MRVILCVLVVLFATAPCGGDDCANAAGSICACECPDGTYVVTFSGHSDSKPSEAVLATGTGTPVRPVASASGTGSSSNYAAGDHHTPGTTNTSGNTTVSVHVKGKNPTCGPTKVTTNAKIKDLDECQWCDMPDMSGC